MGKAELLKQLANNTKAKVVNCFSSEDYNFEVEDKDVDYFIEYCEEHLKLTCVMVG